MPNLPGRLDAFIAKHGSTEREGFEVTGTVAGATRRWPCPGCGISVPEAQRCTPCAVAEVERWKAAKVEARKPDMSGWASGRKPQ